MNGRAATRKDHALGALLCAAYVALLLGTAPALGLSRDEGMYVVAARSYGGWFEQLWHDPHAALERSAIDRAWGVNHEHPPLWKSLFALSALADDKLSLFTRESLPYRFPGMLSAGLLLWSIYVFGLRLYGQRAGLFAALVFALLPRPFYHAHLCCFDVPITLMVTVVSYAYLRSLRERSWAIACGALFGLALATKHNSWLLPGIFAAHFAIVGWLDRPTRTASPSGTARLSRVPYWLIAMAVLGPPIFVGSWPWLWHDTLDRVGEYAAFHLHHEYYNMEYFGVNYFWPPFPKSYPWVMTAYTVPVTTLALFVVGLWYAFGRELASVRARLSGTDDRERHDATRATVLLLGCLLAPLLAFALPTTPIFGGTKHWFTAYPFLALFAGLGFERALLAYTRLWPARLASLRRPAGLAAALLLLAPAALETAHSHPFGLSHYGLAAGFVPGAADRGMNRQFWGFTTGSLVDFFGEHLPQGGSVYPCDTTDVAFRMLSRDGLLPENIVPNFDIASADYAIVHHELHFLDVEAQIWSVYGSARPAYVLTYDGVPIISVYENPKLAARHAALH